MGETKTEQKKAEDLSFPSLFRFETRKLKPDKTHLNADIINHFEYATLNVINSIKNNICILQKCLKSSKSVHKQALTAVLVAHASPSRVALGTIRLKRRGEWGQFPILPPFLPLWSMLWYVL